MSAPGRAFRWGLLGVVLLALILVPFAIWEESLTELSRSWLASAENRRIVALAVVVLLSLDLALPIPSSFVSAAAASALGAAFGSIAIWLGMTAGALAGYALGRFGGAPLVERFVGAGELERAQRLMDRYGSAMLVVSRGVPVLAEASVVVAGSARMHFARFAVVTAAANLGLSLAYALLASAGWSGAAAVIAPFALGILVPLVAIVVLRRFERSRTE